MIPFVEDDLEAGELIQEQLATAQKALEKAKEIAATCKISTPVKFIIGDHAFEITDRGEMFYYWTQSSMTCLDEDGVPYR